MSDSIVKQEADLRQLAKRINEEHAECERALKDGLQHAVEAGKLLIEAKKQCEHGKWLSWIKENCEFSPRTAQGYMRVFNRLLGDGNAQRVAHLSYRQAMVELSSVRPSREDDADDFDVLERVCREYSLAFQAKSLPQVDRLQEELLAVLSDWNSRVWRFVADLKSERYGLDEATGRQKAFMRAQNIINFCMLQCKAALGEQAAELEAVGA
ncbi:MAG: DUF3102 domain-containing protein [Planctomycetota bacterium]|nr:DUF3102 domain-containing protein [Planctomycetota bacterium]